MPINKKKIVYLLGTGATHAELRLWDERNHLLMNDIREGILKKIVDKKVRVLDDVKDELMSDKVDIEQLITLYESTGSYKHNRIARNLKKLFREEITNRIEKLDSSSFYPKLTTALIDLHEIKDLNEELIGILTLNYEDILEKAIQKVKESIDYSIKINNKHKYFKYGGSTYPILKLHGSFNWKNEFPVKIIDEIIKKEEDVLWIPPSAEKRIEKYPFDLIWGKAKEMLDCDILRIIGCSLNRNDWQLVSLLYTTQKFNQNNQYMIELINYSDIGEEIIDNYTYLRFRTIIDIIEVRNFLIKSYSLDYKEEKKLTETLKEYTNSSNQKINIFDTWLRAKGEYLKERDIDISTDKSFFENYINEVES